MGGSGAIDRSELLTVLLLSGHLLLALVPGADLEAAADPTQRLAPRIGGLRATNRALGSLRQAVRGNGTLRLFQQLPGNHRLELWLRLPSHVHFQSHYGRKRAFIQPTQGRVRTGLGGLRDLYHHGDVQRRRASWTSLAGRYASKPAPQVDLRRHRMGTDRTMDLPLDVIRDECFHGLCLTSSDAKLVPRVVAKS